MEKKKVLLISILVIIIFIVSLVVIFVSRGREKPSPITEQCAFACESGQRVSFCDIERQANKDLKATCDEFSKNPQYSIYNIALCPSISCVVSNEQAAREADQTCVSGLGGKWENPVGEACPQSGEKIVRKLNSSDQASVAGQICCR